MDAANVVPHMLAPQELQTETPKGKVENNTKLLMKSVSVTEDSQGVSVEGDVHSSSVKLPHRCGPIKNEKPELDQTLLKGEPFRKII